MILGFDLMFACQGSSLGFPKQRRLVARIFSFFLRSLPTNHSDLSLLKRWRGSCRSWQADGAVIRTSLLPMLAPLLFLFPPRFPRILRRLWNRLCKNVSNGSSGAKSTDRFSKSVIERLRVNSRCLNLCFLLLNPARQRPARDGFFMSITAPIFTARVDRCFAFYKDLIATVSSRR